MVVIPEFENWKKDSGVLREPDWGNQTFCEAFEHVAEMVRRKDYYREYLTHTGFRWEFPTPKWAEKYLDAVVKVFTDAGWACSHGPCSVNATPAHAFFVYDK